MSPSWRPIETARLVNLLIPGGGLILLGRIVAGLIVALAFTLLCNLALAATLLIPHDVPEWARRASIGATAIVYVLSQLLVAHVVRVERRAAEAERRREILERVVRELAAGRAAEAWEALEPLRPLAESDLLVAYRAAQVLTALGDGPAALRAWKNLRRLDCHRIYRSEIESNERALQEASGPRQVSQECGAARRPVGDESR